MVLSADRCWGVVLVGMRGCGKSSVAPLLARRLDLDYVDADRELSRRAGRSICEVFATDGEPAFRELEREVLLGDLLWREGIVLAAGGGAVLHAEVREVLKRRATVWLRASLSVMAARIRGSQRPSLTGDPIEVELEQVLQQRLVLYQEVATVTVNTDEQRPPEVAALICERLAALADVTHDNV